jgi:hypothetical protein
MRPSLENSDALTTLYEGSSALVYFEDGSFSCVGLINSAWPPTMSLAQRAALAPHDTVVLTYLGRRYKSTVLFNGVNWETDLREAAVQVELRTQVGTDERLSPSSTST